MSERVFFGRLFLVAALAFFAVALIKSEIRHDGATTLVWIGTACFLLLLAIYARMP